MKTEDNKKDEEIKQLRKRIKELEKSETEHKQAVKELSMKEAQYRGIFEASKDTFLIFNMNGVIKEVNPAACKMYGYSYEEMIGLSGKNIVHTDYQYLFKEFVEKATAGKIFSAESVNIREDGSLFDIEVRGSTFEYKGESHLLAVIRDITKRKKAEEEINKLKDELEIKVAEQTKELKVRVSELERFYEATIDREFRMKELRDEIEKLKGRG